MPNVYASKIEHARNSRLQLTRIHTSSPWTWAQAADAILADQDNAERREMLEAMEQEIIAALDAIDTLQGWPRVPHRSPHG